RQDDQGKLSAGCLVKDDELSLSRPDREGTLAEKRLFHPIAEKAGAVHHCTRPQAAARGLDVPIGAVKLTSDDFGIEARLGTILEGMCQVGEWGRPGVHDMFARDEDGGPQPF